MHAYVCFRDDVCVFYRKMPNWWSKSITRQWQLLRSPMSMQLGRFGWIPAFRNATTDEESTSWQTPLNSKNHQLTDLVNVVYCVQTCSMVLNVVMKEYIPSVGTTNQRIPIDSLQMTCMFRISGIDHVNRVEQWQATAIANMGWCWRAVPVYCKSTNIVHAETHLSSRDGRL